MNNIVCFAFARILIYLFSICVSYNTWLTLLMYCVLSSFLFDSVVLIDDFGYFEYFLHPLIDEHFLFL